MKKTSSWLKTQLMQTQKERLKKFIFAMIRINLDLCNTGAAL